MKTIRLEQINLAKMSEDLGVCRATIRSAFKVPKKDSPQRVDEISSIAEAKRWYLRTKNKERKLAILLKWLDLAESIQDLNAMPFCFLEQEGEALARFDTKKGSLLVTAINQASSFQEIVPILDFASNFEIGPEWWTAFKKGLRLAKEGDLDSLYKRSRDDFGESKNRIFERIAELCSPSFAQQVIITENDEGYIYDDGVGYRMLLRRAAELYRKF